MNEEAFTLSSNFNRLRAEKSKFPAYLTALLIFVAAGLIYFGTLGESAAISFGIIATIAAVYLIIRYPRLWIYLTIAMNPYFFFARGEEISPVEIGVAFFYLGALTIWIIWSLAVNKEKLVQNKADLAFLFFFALLAVNAVIAYSNGVNLLYWGRECANLYLALFYLPIRKYFTEKKHLLRLLFLYLAVVSVTAGLHFYTYYIAMQSDVVYAYQLITGISINQTLFTSAALIGFIFALYQKKFSKSIALILFTGIAVAGLVTSFSRTFWVLIAFEIIFILFYLKKNQRKRYLSYFSIAVVTLLATGLFVFQDKAQIFLEMVESRFSSVSKGTEDVSVQARLDEYEKVVGQISKYPLGGTGAAKEFTFWNFLTGQTRRTRIIHNGYLYMARNFGIPLAIVYFFPFFYYLFKSEKYARKIDDEFFRVISLGALTTLVCMIVSDITMAQVMQREGAFVIAFAFAAVGIVDKNVKDEKIKLKS